MLEVWTGVLPLLAGGEDGGPGGAGPSTPPRGEDRGEDPHSTHPGNGGPALPGNGDPVQYPHSTHPTVLTLVASFEFFVVEKACD